MRLLYYTLMFAFAQTVGYAQLSTEAEVVKSWELRKKYAEKSLLKNYPVRSLGPTAPGGRVTDIDVNPRNHKEFYVALASGGIFKTTNNGVTFSPVFDNTDALSIGDIAICPADPSVILAGTGEKNSSRSSYAGSGLYKSVDAGTSWQRIGLAGTQHIGRIVFHPKDVNTIWVAAIGSLFSHNRERGLYKTTDGGQTWRKTLFINDSTGIIDVTVNPRNPDMLLATSWERTRRPGDFKGAGKSSCIYRSSDGGETWSKSVDGFPQDANTGRIGLSLCNNQPNIVYAVVDRQAQVPNPDNEKKLQKEHALLAEMRKMRSEELIDSQDDFLETVLATFNIHNQYTPAGIKQSIREGKYTPGSFAAFLENFASSPDKILGAEVYRSDDDGKSWKKMNTYDLDGVFFSYGYYFGEIAVSPADPELVYLQGVPLLKSRDGGKTWHRLDTIRIPRPVHVDHHAMWINPDDPHHILLGNDGGVYQSYDEGATWLHLNSISAGQFYTVNVDMQKPYHVYGGLQDNGVWKGSSDGAYWKQLFSGDGMYVIPDPKDPATIFTGYHYGNYFRMEMDKKKSVRISPLHDVTEDALRWNWRSPLMMSSHDGSLYIAANRIMQSSDKGQSWKTISPDLTKEKPQGNVAFSTISALAESPLQKGLLYAGTDDGNVFVTRDGGATWSPVSSGLPADKFVSSIFASPHAVATVFIAMNGYRHDDFHTYLFRSNDHGTNWLPVDGNLPDAVANVIIQDPVSADLLYCGLDNGVWASFNAGVSWEPFCNIPNVAGYDMVVHPRVNELVVATHGRGLFIVDVKPLQSLSKTTGSLLVVFKPSCIKHSETWGEKKYPWSPVDIPGTKFLVHAAKPGHISLELRESSGRIVKKFYHDAVPGFNLVPCDLTIENANNQYLAKGNYIVRVSSGKSYHEAPFQVE